MGLLSATSGLCASSLTLSWDPSPETESVTGYRLYWGSMSRGYTSSLTIASGTSGTVNDLAEGAVYFFAVTAISATGLESDYSTEVVYTNQVTTPFVNQQPTLNPIAGRNINENSGAQTVTLSGITAGTGESQEFTITATSSNPGLIPHPTISYASPSMTGTLTFQPVNYEYGFSTITVVVNDGQAQNATASRSFNVVVNDRPYISAIYDQALAPGTTLPPIQFTVSDTETPASNLVISATSSLPSLLPETNIVFSMTNDLRFLTLIPITGQWGTSTVTVAVNDGLATSTTTFRMMVSEEAVNPITGAPHISSFTNIVMEKGATAGPIPFTIWDGETPAENLTLEVSSSVPALVPNAAVVFGGAGTNRNLTITPAFGQSGESIIAVTVSDGGTVATTSFHVTVLSGTQSALQIASNGKGSVIGSYGSQPVLVGSTYTVTAVPEPGQVFAGWSGSMVSANPRLTFTAAAAMQLKANFAPVGHEPTSSHYNGLFREESAVRHNSSGSCTFKLSAKGVYSGVLRVGKERRSFKGHFSSEYLQATNEFSLENGRTLRLEFSVLEDGSKVLGRLNDGDWEAPLLATRSISDQPEGAGAFAGIYTLVMPSQGTAGPAGQSYASVKVNRRGVARLIGKLADGTKVSQSASLSSDGKWPLHAALYSRGGSMLSWLAFTNAPDQDLTGTMHWNKPSGSKGLYPGGFTTASTAWGSRFTPEQAPWYVDANLILGSGVLPSPLTQVLNLDEKGRFASTPTLSFKSSNQNGLFHGRVIDPVSGTKLKFGGAMLQKQATGCGFLLGADQTSTVRIAKP